MGLYLIFLSKDENNSGENYEKIDRCSGIEPRTYCNLCCYYISKIAAIIRKIVWVTLTLDTIDAKVGLVYHNLSCCYRHSSFPKKVRSDKIVSLGFSNDFNNTMSYFLFLIFMRIVKYNFNSIITCTIVYCFVCIFFSFVTIQPNMRLLLITFINP